MRYNKKHMFFLTSPLEQFELIPMLVFKLKSHIFGWTNQTCFLLLLLFVSFFLFRIVFTSKKMKSNTYQIFVEQIFSFVQQIVLSNIGSRALPYFPLIFTVFLFILNSNFLGMVPYAFTITSHIFVTFFLALALFLGINIIGLRKHGLTFFEFFLPAGISIFAAPFFVVIELLSYLSRVFSLSIRLFANLLSGHALLKILIGFS